MRYTLGVVLMAFALGFFLYQIPPVQVFFSSNDLNGMFQLASFLILVYILYLLIKRERK